MPPIRHPRTSLNEPDTLPPGIVIWTHRLQHLADRAVLHDRWARKLWQFSSNPDFSGLEELNRRLEKDRATLNELRRRLKNDVAVNLRRAGKKFSN